MINIYCFNYYLIRLFEDVQEVSIINFLFYCAFTANEHTNLPFFSIELSPRMFRKRQQEMLKSWNNSKIREAKTRLIELRRERWISPTQRSTSRSTKLTHKLTLMQEERQEPKETSSLKLSLKLSSLSEPEGKYCVLI